MNILIRAVWAGAAAGLFVLGGAARCGADTIDIGSRVEPFVDRALIESMSGAARLVLHEPRQAEVAISFEKPWEGPECAYVTVLQAETVGYRMYYRGSSGDESKKLYHEYTCMAESGDGVTWTKPELGLFEFEGSKANNIVWSGMGTHNFSPFVDRCPREGGTARYKAVGGTEKLFAFASGDGVHWSKLREDPIITKGAFDSQNLAFWSEHEGKYVCYFRVFIDGVRAISRATSDDFVTWSEPVALDLGAGPAQDLYTNATVPCPRAPHIYLSFPKRFMPERKAVATWPFGGVSDGVMMSSRDGVHFDRTFLDAFVRPGRDQENWTDRNNMAAWGILETGNRELSMYYSEHYRHPDARIRRRVLRPEGFASLHGDFAGGEVVTKPIVMQGEALLLNFATSAAGSMRVELQDAEGKALPGFALGDCPEFYGDAIGHEVQWKGGARLQDCSGKPIRVRFELKDADVYSMHFGNVM